MISSSTLHPSGGDKDKTSLISTQYNICKKADIQSAERAEDEHLNHPDNLRKH